MTIIPVGMGELQVSTDPSSVLVSYALGSCVAVLAYDPVRNVGGMMHCMLPFGRSARSDARTRPAMFADAGLSRLLRQLRTLSCSQKDLVISVVGGAHMQDDDYFEIGKRNYLVIRQLFAQAGLQIRAEVVGGRVARTVRLFVHDGRVTLRASDSFCDVEL